MGLTIPQAEIISAGVGFMGNMIGSGAGAGYSHYEAEQNRKFQEYMYNRQVADTERFWRMQNEYNLPSAAYARELQGLKENNLNPYLMYSNGAPTGNLADQPQLPSAPHGSQAQVGSFNTRVDLANIAVAEAQARLLNTQSEKLESEREGQDFLNWLNDNSRNVQLALKYRDYDYVNSVIDKNRNEVFQSSFRNGTEMASLSLMNTLAIRRQNLSEYEVGQNIEMGWQNVINGRISANAQVKNAFAAMMNATTAARLAPYQIGVMRATASRLSEETKFLSESRSYRVQQEFQRLKLMQKDVTWYDVLRESGISEQQSRTFLNTMHSDEIFQNMEWQPYDELMKPLNMLTGFGAGMLVKGTSVNYSKPKMSIPWKKSKSMNPYE